MDKDNESKLQKYGLEFIKDLISKQYAYEVNGSVYFDVGKFENYGELSPTDYSEETAGAAPDENPAC